MTRNILLASVLIGAFALSAASHDFVGAWSANWWAVDLLKGTLPHISILKSASNDISTSPEQIALARQPVTGREFFFLGRVHESLGEQKAAINEYEKVLAKPYLNKLDLSFQIMLSTGLGHLLFKQRQYSKAISILQYGIGISKGSNPAYTPPMVQMYWDLAESVNSYSGDRVAYEKYMLQAISLQPTNTGLNEALMEHYLGWNDLENANTLAKRWSTEDPKSSRSVFYMGRIYQLKGDCGTARILYKQAISMESQYFFSHFWLAFCDDQLGDLESAVLEFRYAISLAPSEWWLYRQLGNTLIKIGQFADAQDVLIKGLSLNPQDGWTQQLLEEAKRLSSEQRP